MVHCLQYIFLCSFEKECQNLVSPINLLLYKMKLNLHFLRINTDQEEQP